MGEPGGHDGQAGGSDDPGCRCLTLTIAKLADTIIVREDGDIDAIGEAVAKKVIQALKNMPQPA